MARTYNRVGQPFKRIGAIRPQRKLLALLVLLAFPTAQTQPVFAEAPQLPDLGQTPTSTSIIRPSGNRVTLENTFDGKKFQIAPEYSNNNGLGIAAALAALIGEHAAVGVLLNAGSGKKELLVNAGFQPDASNRFILSVGQLRQFFDIAFVSGAEKAEMTQTSGGLGYQLYLGRELLNYLELNGYLADTPSRSLGDKTFSVDTATLYELWNDQRRIAGGRVTGLQGKLALTPLPGGTVKLGFGSERLTMDYLTGGQSVNRLTGGAEWQQKLGNGYAFNLGGDSAAAESRYTLGLSHSAPTDSGGSRQLGIGLTAIRGRDGMRDDNQIKLSYTANFDGGKKAAAARPGSGKLNAPAWPNMLDQVALRPLYLPMQAVAKLDTTATPVRLIAVDKTALPSGATLDAATGNVNAALPRAAAGIAGVTRNSAPFVNSGQFSLSNGGLVVNPKLIEQPAVGVKDTYVVTLNNAGGGTTLVTVVVSHGSVKIDSIRVADGDITPPVISGVAVGSIAALTATLTATLNEAGSGYYVVLPASSATPSATQVKNGQDASGSAAASKGSTAMTANTPGSIAIAGLTAATAYKVHFAAIDSANNLQPAVSSASFTSAAAKTTPDAFDIADMAGQPVASAITTNTITVSGINIPVSAATSVGTLVKNGANTNAATASVVSGDTLAVRLTTAATVTSPPITGTLTVGTFSDGFSISTAAIDTIPDAFSFNAQYSVAFSTQVESNAVTVGGINAPAPLSVSGGEYQINGGAWSSAAGTVGNGNSVKVRHTSAAGYSGTTQTTLTIGGVAGVFATTTVAPPPPPPAADAAPTIANAGDTITEDTAVSYTFAQFATKMGYADADGDAITSMTLTIPAGMSLTIGGVVKTGVVTYASGDGSIQFNGNGTPGVYNMNAVANNLKASSAAKTYAETVTNLPVVIANVVDGSAVEGFNLVKTIAITRANVEFASNGALQAATSVNCAGTAVTGVQVTGADIAAGTVEITGTAANSAAPATVCTISISEDGVVAVSNSFSLTADPII